MQGNLRDMTVADLIQHNCQDRRTARLALDHRGQAAELFFRDGHVVHAACGDVQGEEAVYRLLTWEDGHFQLENGVEPPAVSIRRSWSALLLEGASRLDEGQHKPIQHTHQEVKTVAKKKSELLAEALAELLQESSDIEGAAIIGTDGLVYSAMVPQRSLDETLVGATAAAVLGLSRRSAEQLKRGGFRQTLVQAEEGNLIVAGIDGQTLFVGLTPKNVNLGMAFAEVRSMTDKVRSIL
jgi:predicted regulator of Ras-like GTPase activity (Roadblock/LC7/MglB family)